MVIAIADAFESREGGGLYNVSRDENFSIFSLAKATAEAFGNLGCETEVVPDSNLNECAVFVPTTRANQLGLSLVSPSRSTEVEH